MAKYDEWLTPQGLDRLEQLSGRGLTDRELAAALRITDRTLREWQEKYSGISDAIAHGRRGAQEQIENALFRRALGGVHGVLKPVKLRIREYDENTGRCVREEETVELREEEVYIPPDTNALKFWLTNRAPEKWTNRLEVQADGSIRMEDVADE